MESQTGQASEAPGLRYLDSAPRSVVPALQAIPVGSASQMAALRDSVARYGVLVPVVVDAAGALVDGRARAAAAAEFLRPVPAVVLPEGVHPAVAAVLLNAGRIGPPEARAVTMARILQAYGPSRELAGSLALALGLTDRTAAAVLFVLEKASKEISSDYLLGVIGLREAMRQTWHAMRQANPRLPEGPPVETRNIPAVRRQWPVPEDRGPDELGDAIQLLGVKLPVAAHDAGAPPAAQPSSPAQVTLAISRARELQAAAARLRRLASAMLEWQHDPACALVDIRSCAAAVRDVARAIAEGAPYDVCPVCSGVAPPGCVCGARGWVNAATMRQIEMALLESAQSDGRGGSDAHGADRT